MDGGIVGEIRKRNSKAIPKKITEELILSRITCKNMGVWGGISEGLMQKFLKESLDFFKNYRMNCRGSLWSIYGKNLRRSS